MKDLIKLVEFYVGTIPQRRLQGTLIISVKIESITNDNDIVITLQNGRRNKHKNITIVFGLLVGLATSREGVPTIQVDQLNVIAHHFYEINTNGDLWPDKEEAKRKQS